MLAKYAVSFRKFLKICNSDKRVLTNRKENLDLNNHKYEILEGIIHTVTWSWLPDNKGMNNEQKT